MAGHSKFKNIMHRKGAQDKKELNFFKINSRDKCFCKTWFA